jgi:hypothetical protein
MTTSDLVETAFILIGLAIALYASTAFIYRLVKRQAFWPSFKRMVKLIFDAIWGMG